jgi:hypothetical protein
LKKGFVLRQTRVFEERKDRRATLRFPLFLPLSVRTLSPPHCLALPTGTTMNISSNGLLFEISERLQPEQRVSVSVEWPVRLDSRIPLNLVLEGRILRWANGVAAMRIHRHEFRIRKSAPAQSAVDDGLAGETVITGSPVRIAAFSYRGYARPA